MEYSLFFFYTIVLCTLSINVVCQLTTVPYDIRIDQYKIETINDLVINTARPRFSWKLFTSKVERNVKQIAYQIQLKSRVNNFDSRKILSNQSIHVLCPNMNDLESGTFYQMRIRIWTTQSNRPSPWTDWIRFRTSLFNIHSLIVNKNDSLIWIGSTQIPMNEFRKEFEITNLTSILSSIVYISGVGYYELFVNGKRVDTSRKLDPGWTVYEKRTLVVTYDLTSTIKVVHSMSNNC